ncbi:MAG: Ig-like domain repeat protein [Terracidiphilus sp.]
MISKSFVSLFSLKQVAIPAVAASWNSVAARSFGWVALTALLAFGGLLPAQTVFTPQPVGKTSTPMTATVTVQTTGTVGKVAVLTAGVAGMDFAAGSGSSTCAAGAVTKGQTCTESVTFTPSAPGVRKGAVVLLDDSGVALGTAYLTGIGQGGLAVLEPGNVQTVAGEYRQYTGEQDGVPATQSQLRQPSSVVLDGAGNMYIADSGIKPHNRVRKVTASTGIISTVTGTGDAGFSGDNGPASQASLNSPSGVALDGAGSLYIADTGNGRLRMIPLATTATAPIIVTVAGGGSGCGGQTDSVGDGCLATQAMLNNPQGVTVDSAGNLFIADWGNQRIRRVDAATGIITTVAGNGKASGKGDGKGTYTGDGGPATLAGLSDPYPVAFDADGDMYIPDSANNAVRRVDAKTQVITTVAGDGKGNAGYTGDGGPATSARLNAPSGVLLDPAGNLYISDTQNTAIRKVNATTRNIATLVVNGGSSTLDAAGNLGKVQIFAPIGLFQDGKGDVYFADFYYMVIQKIEANASVLDFTGTPVQVKDVSAPQQQTMENDGNMPLQVSSLAPDKNSALDTASTTCSLSSPLDADANCKVGLVFAPSIAINFPAGATQEEVVAHVMADGYTDGNASDTEDFPLDMAIVGIATPVNATTTTVSSSKNPSAYGMQLTFTATVTSNAGVPTGKVTFTDTTTTGTVTLASNLPLDAAGAALFTTTTPLAVGTHTITANYTPTGTFLNSSGTLTQTVGEVTTTTLASSANPSLLGSQVTFTATVAIAGGGGVTPDGTVSFSIDGTVVAATAPLVGGQATYQTSTLTLGNHSVSATYSGDTGKGILTSTASLKQDVQTTSTTAVTSSLNPSNYGEAVTFTATVTGNGTVALTGSVTFLDGGNKIGTGTLSGTPNGTAALTTSSLTAGAHTITAQYGGDADYQASASPPITQTVNQTTTSTTVSATPNPGIAGKPVAITATVKVTAGAAAVTGTVTFTDALTKTALGSAQLGSAGTATINPTLAPGSYSVVAVYGGDANDNSSTSAAYALSVVQATTSTALTSSQNPSVVGAQVTFTATVTGNGATPTGSVNFLDGTTVLGTGNLSTSGVATFATATLAAGTHSITAAYLGDTNDAKSTSAPLSQVVGKIDTVTGLAPSATTTTPPQAFLIATVLDANLTTPGPTPTGTVTFMDHDKGTAIGTGTLDANGVTTLTPSLPTGKYNVDAVYSGDDIHNPSTSGVVQFNTTAAGFNLTVTPPAVSVPSGENTSITVNLTSVDGFTDTIGLGCGSLPSGVNCHFSKGDLTLPANGAASTVLTIDTGNPLGGGGTAMNNRTTKGGTALAGLFLPVGVFFGLVFWRFRRRHARVFALALMLLAGGAALVVSGCSGFSQIKAAPGTYTIQVVGVGSGSNVTHYQNVKLTITGK